MIFRSIEQVRRFFRILAGFTLLLIGAIMLFTPGPGWLVIFLGLTLLAAEYVWARRLMERMKHEGNRLKDSVLRFNKNEAAKGNPSEGSS
jgi:tellurite resistance protein TerC